jgi:tripartite-type tricarboxylate transporter receptor subunit TctC
MKLSTRLTQLAAILACCGIVVSTACAQQYPSKLVKFLVPQAPGGATDVFARKVGQMLSERWGQPVIVENRAGAAGVIGTNDVAKAPADGYTLLVTYAGSQAINPSLYPNLPFDSIKDFQPVATLANTPFYLIANPKLPVKDLREFIALAEKQPDVYTFASSGIGSVNHLLGMMLKTETGIKIRHVPYRGVAAAISDVIAGHVDTAFSSVPSVLGVIRGGQIRALAVSSAKRVAVTPDVPTIAESGLPRFDVNPWWGILAPAETDMTIVHKINTDVAEILRTQEMVEFLAKQGAEPFVTTPDEFRTILRSDIDKWAKVVKAADVKLN